jgi:hypothetical protein
MPACSSHWEAQQDGGRANPSDAAQQGRWSGELKWRRDSHAKPVSNRHHEELARKNDAATHLALPRWWN